MMCFRFIIISIKITKMNNIHTYILLKGGVSDWLNKTLIRKERIMLNGVELGGDSRKRKWTLLLHSKKIALISIRRKYST